MELDENKASESNEIIPHMRIGMRVLLWIVTFNMVIATGFVWAMAFFVVHEVRVGIWVSISDFRDLMLGYHILLLTVTLICWHMQGVWRSMGETMAYPAGMVIGLLMLNVAAIKLGIIAFSHRM